MRLALLCYAFACDASTFACSVHSLLTISTIQSLRFWTQNIFTLKLLASTFVNDWFWCLTFIALRNNWIWTVVFA